MTPITDQPDLWRHSIRPERRVPHDPVTTCDNLFHCLSVWCHIRLTTWVMSLKISQICKVTHDSPKSLMSRTTQHIHEGPQGLPSLSTTHHDDESLHESVTHPGVRPTTNHQCTPPLGWPINIHTSSQYTSGQECRYRNWNKVKWPLNGAFITLSEFVSFI